MAGPEALAVLRLMRTRLIAVAAVGTPLLATILVLTVSRADTIRGDGLADAAVAIVALTAAASCAWAAMRSAGRTRAAWSLIAASAAAALVGAAIDSVYLLLFKGTPALPSSSDAGFLVAVPLAIAGLLAFPLSGDQAGQPVRIALDLLMVGLSLAFISVALGLPQAYFGQHSPLYLVTGALYRVADVALVMAIFIALRRSLGGQGIRLSLVALGLAINAFANSAGAYLVADGHLTAAAPVLGDGSIYGYAVIALAALFKAPAAEPSEAIPQWPDLIPYFGVSAVAVTTALLFVTGQPIEPLAVVPGVGLLALLAASQYHSYLDARRLIVLSRRSEEQLRVREQMLNNVIDHAPQGVAVIRPDLRITKANPRLASMLYAPMEVLVGSKIDAFLSADYVGLVFGSFASANGETSDTYESDTQTRRADASTFWTHWSCTPVRAADGSVDYFMVTFEDVTAKREADETAVANLAQLEKLNRLKSEFVSMVSHEFRTALVGIQGFSELLKDQDMDARETRQIATDIYNDAMRLNRMITEMLDFDRLEAGKVRLELGPLDMNDLASQAVERARVLSDKHAITAELQRGLPEVMGDSDRLMQVMTNLLSNAIKYSPEGGDIRVATRLSGGAAEIAVRDHGRGIPPEFIKRLFGKYERYEDKHAGKIIGTGLGLAITRQIVEMHGGRIMVSSEVGRGSEFRFTVPLAVGDVASATRA